MNEEVIELEILKINHDEELENIVKKYPLEEYNIDVISCLPLDARREQIRIKISKKELENNIKRIGF